MKQRGIRFGGVDLPAAGEIGSEGAEESGREYPPDADDRAVDTAEFERQVLAVPGAAERVAEIERGFRGSVGVNAHPLVGFSIRPWWLS